MERSQEVLDLYRRLVRGQLQGLPIDQVVSSSPALSVFGTAPEEWWTDRATITRMLEAVFQAGDQGMQALPAGDAQAWSEGDFAWVVDRPRMRAPNGAEVQLRVTTILHREGAQWKVIHQHASIGVPNDQVEAFRGL